MVIMQLFLSFLQIGLFSIGGGYAAIPLIQAQVVDRFGWLTLKEFTDLITIAEMTPGPIAVNSATFTGMQIGGFGGAVAATFGCILPSCFIVTILTVVYYRYRSLDTIKKTLGTLRPVVVALIASAGVTILGLAARLSGGEVNWAGLGVFALDFIMLRWKKINPILIMALSGVVFLVLGLFGVVTV